MTLTDSDAAYEPSAPDPIDVHLGAKLRELRTFRRVTLEALGDALGVSHSQIVKYETGETRMSAAALYRAARALGIKPEWFFEELDAGTPGEQPFKLDAAARRLLDAFDQIDSAVMRKLLASFVDGVARGVIFQPIKGTPVLAVDNTASTDQ